METPRLPRFTRTPRVRPIRITPRDLEIIRQVNRHRFLRSSHIRQLVDGSPQQILRRLQHLYHHSYLERPRAQLDYFHRAGSEPIVCGLGTKGAELLRDDLVASRTKLNWNWKNQSVGRLFLEHAVLTADIMVALESACGRHGGLRLFDRGDINSLGHPRAKAFRWSVKLANGRKVGVVPDRVFAMETIGRHEGDTLSHFFLEADRGTMPVKRNDPTRSSFFRKLLAYHATWRQGLHRTRLGIPRFRVLTVTSSAERMENMLLACRELDSGHGLFLFAEVDALRHSDPLTFLWTSGRGDRVQLLEHPTTTGSAREKPRG